MSLGGIRIIWAGQSNAFAYTPERDVTDAKYSPVVGVPAWIWFQAGDDLKLKRTPWTTYAKARGYLHDGGTPDISSRNWPGAELPCAWSLKNIGHSPHVIQIAQGGTSLAVDWNPNQTTRMYRNLTHDYAAAIASRYAPADPGATRTVLVWIQGETDAANEAYSLAYQDNWDDFIAAARSDLGLASLKVIMVKLNTACTATYTANVRAAQVAIAGADALVTLVDSDAYALAADGLHYTAAGATGLGLALATAISGVMP